MGLWNAPFDLKSADFLVHFGNHFGDKETDSNNSKVGKVVAIKNRHYDEAFRH